MALGDVVLIYPKTDAFDKALPVFEFPKSSGMRLWVLPFCLREKRLLLPPSGSLNGYFAPMSAVERAPQEFPYHLREVALV